MTSTIGDIDKELKRLLTERDKMVEQLFILEHTKKQRSICEEYKEYFLSLFDRYINKER